MDNLLRYGMAVSNPNNPLSGPTWADAADWHMQNLADTWQAMQQPQTWVDAARQYGNAMLMGTAAPRTAPLRYYGMGDATSLNYRLREGLPLSETDQQVLSQVEGKMQPAGEDRVLWRGLTAGPFVNAKPGEVIHDLGMASTSTNVDQARQFASGYVAPQVLRISVPKGTPIADLSDYGGESEFVLPRGMQYRVDEVISRQGRPPTVLVTAIGARKQ